MSRKLDNRVFKIVGGFSLLFGDVPFFSTRMDEAMKVINKIDSDAMTSDFTLTRDYEGVWTVKLKPAGCREEWVFGHRPEVCMLLAALRAKGDDEWVDNYLKKGTINE